MPREQRTSLNKSPVTEVALGTLTSGVDQTINMPIVQPVKSAGQSLAEGLGVVAKGAAKLYQIKINEKNKAEAERTKLEHELSGNNQGDIRGRAAADAISKLVIDGEPATNQQKHEAVMQTVGKLEFTDDMSVDFYRSYYKAVMRPLDALEKSWRTKAIADAKTAQVEANNKLTLGNLYDGTMTGNQIVDKMRTSDAYTNAELLTKYVDMAVSNGKMLQNLAIEEPSLHTFDKDAYFTKYLHIKVGENTPGGALDLRSNPSTGDKIRAFKAYLTSDNNKAFTSNTKAYKELTKSLELNPDTTPSDYNKHIKAGAKLGYYNDTKNNPEVANLQAKFDAKYVKAQVKAATSALSSDQASIKAALDDDKVYLNNNVRNILGRFKKNLEKQVGMGKITSDEARLKYKIEKDDAEKYQNHLSFKNSFTIDNESNNINYTNMSSENRQYAKAETEGSLQQAYDSFKKDPNLVDGFAKTLTDVGLKNIANSKDFLASLFPMSTDPARVTESLGIMKALFKMPRGADLFSTLSTNSRLYYDSLNANMNTLGPKDDSISEDEAITIKRLITDSEGVDYGVKITKIRNNKKKIRKAIAGLPDRVQREMALTFDYISQSMGDSAASNYLVNVVRPRYFQEYTSNLLSDKIKGINKLTIINGVNSPRNLVSNSPTQANALLSKLVTAKVNNNKDSGESKASVKDVLNSYKGKDVRITWDVDNNEWQVIVAEDSDDVGFEVFRVTNPQ